MQEGERDDRKEFPSNQVRTPVRRKKEHKDGSLVELGKYCKSIWVDRAPKSCLSGISSPLYLNNFFSRSVKFVDVKSL